MSIQQVLAVINQKNKASFPNQEAQRVFAKLQKNHNVRMDQVSQANSLADQYLQSAVSKNQITAPPVDEAANIASSQVVGKVPVDQAELVATGQGSVQQKQSLQNVGISSGGSSINNLSSTNIATNETSAQRFLQTERDEIASQLGEQGLPITPTRVELELANRLGSDAYLYGPKYTQRKQALQAGASYEPKLFNTLNVPSVQIAGQNIPYSPTRGSDVSLRVPTYTESTALNLKAAADKQKDFRGQIRLEATSNMRAIEAQAKPIKQAQIQARNRNDFATVDRLETELNKLRGSYQKQQRRISGAESKVAENISNLKVPLKLPNQQLSAEVDQSTGKVVIRPEKLMIDTDAKGGGGRNIANYTGSGLEDEKVRSMPTGGLIQETPQRLRQTLGRYRDYDPGTDELNQGGGAPQPPYRDDSGLTGGVVDIYGIRKSADPKDISRVKPSQLVGEMRGAQNQKVSKEAQEIIKRSLKVSEDRRRARIEGAAPVNYDSYLNKKPLGSYVPAEEKPIKRGKTGGLLGEFLSKSYYSVNKFPSI